MHEYFTINVKQTLEEVKEKVNLLYPQVDIKHLEEQIPQEINSNIF